MSKPRPSDRRIASAWRPGMIISLAIMASIASAGDVKTNDSAPRVDARLQAAVEVFTVKGHKAFLILSTNRAPGEAGPWVWYAPVQGNSDRPGGHLTWMIERFLAAGISVAGINTDQAFSLYGGPDDRALFTALYDELVRQRGLSPKPCLLAQSRGGFQIYSWAAEHPGSVACIAGIFAAYDPTGWTSYTGSPLRHLEGLAGEHVPLFNVHGDADDKVPLEKHAAELHRRYRQLGGEARLLVIKGRGHEVLPEYFQCQPLVDFVIARAKAGVEPAPGKP